MTDNNQADEERRRQKDEDLYYQKELAFYSQAVAAFFSTALELDKSFLTISLTAVGFLVTLIATMKAGLFLSTIGSVFFFLSLLAFTATGLLVLAIFHFNKGAVTEFIKAAPGTTEPGPNGEKIRKLDVGVKWVFGTGVFSLMLFGLFTADRLLDHRINVVTTTNDNRRPSGSQMGTDLNSFSKATDLRPGQDVIKSFTGGQQLRPQPISTSHSTVQGTSSSSNAGGTSSTQSTAPSSNKPK